MKTPLSTGQVAALLATTEPRLNHLIRRRLIQPAPTLVAGRRLWNTDHVREAAEHLGCLTPELEQQLAEPGEEPAHA